MVTKAMCIYRPHWKSLDRGCRSPRYSCGAGLLSGGGWLPAFPARQDSSRGGKGGGGIRGLPCCRRKPSFIIALGA